MRAALLLSLLVSLFMLSASVRAQDTDEPPETNLAALVTAAEGGSPGMRAARHGVAAASARLGEAVWSPFFQITATGSLTLAPEAHGSPIFSEDSQLPLDNPWAPALAVRIESAIPLWTFGKLSGARDAAQAGVEAAEQGRERTRAELRYSVRRAYFGLALALDMEQMLNEGRGKLDHAVRRIEERIEAGDADANEMDQWRLASTLAEVEARGSEAARLRSASERALLLLAGMQALRVRDCPMQQASYSLRALDTYVADALRSRPEAAMLRAGLTARHANLSATRARYLPDVALAVLAGTSYAPGITNQTNPFVFDPANATSLGAAVVARWSLDVPGNMYRTARAEEELMEGRAQADEAFVGIELDVSSAYYEIIDAERREQAWTRGHRDARSWFVAAAQAHEIGAIEPRDLVDAVRAYFTARLSHMTAIRDYNTALAHLERAVGSELLAPDGWEQPCE